MQHRALAKANWLDEVEIVADERNPGEGLDFVTEPCLQWPNPTYFSQEDIFLLRMVHIKLKAPDVLPTTGVCSTAFQVFKNRVCGYVLQDISNYLFFEQNDGEDNEPDIAIK